MSEKQFNISTWVDGKCVEFQEPLDDPFVNHTTRSTFSWRDRFRLLLGGKHVVNIVISGTPEAIHKVMNIKYDGHLEGVLGDTTNE